MLLPRSSLNPELSVALADLDGETAAKLRGSLVVEVVVSDEGHTRCSHVRSLGAAERAVERAKRRGRRARVFLVRLEPVGEVVMLR